ncbi:MAG: site-2 protease family protein [Myxococcota bacterium]
MNDISLGRIFGFPLALQPSALLILAIFVLMGARDGAASMGNGVLLALVVFGSILVHELGHAFVARAFKLGPIDITLHGFGGFTRFGRVPGPKQGILVTLAGPGASFLLGGAALLAVMFVDAGRIDHLLGTAASINLFWGVFNLLPMYPLDGGLVTWHGLSLFTAKDTAQKWAARIGVLVAVGVGTVAGLAGEIFIAIIAVMSLMRSVPLALEPARR